MTFNLMKANQTPPTTKCIPGGSELGSRTHSDEWAGVIMAVWIYSVRLLGATSRSDRRGLQKAMSFLRGPSDCRACCWAEQLQSTPLPSIRIIHGDTCIEP